jgi:TRAP transporter TAXI family solute receptor
MRSMSKRFSGFALAGIFLITLAAVQTAAAAELQRYVMGSGPMGGPWRIGVGAGVQLINEQLKDKYFFTAAASGGSVENTRRMVSGEYHTTWIQGGNMYEVWTATGIFAGQKPYKEMRMLEYMIDQALNIVVLGKSSIKSISDLAGKRVNLGPAGSGWVDISKTMLRSLGIENKIKANYLNFEAGAQALKDGQLDATFSPGGPYATPAIVEISRSVPIRLLEPQPDEGKKIVAAIPYLRVGVIPANKAPGENADRDRKAFLGAVYWVAQAGMPEQVIYDVLKVTQEPKNKELLGKVLSYWTTAGPEFDPIAQLGIPLHPGAAKFWKEQGAKIPAELLK